MFLDCQFFCDFDFIRTEISFVNFVRDRKEGEVHILVTSQRTGSGGAEYTLRFIGLERFAGIDHTLQHVSEQTATGDEIRRALTRIIKIGLASYVATTPQGAGLDVQYKPPAGPRQNVVGDVKDPWNLWYFRSRLNGNFSGEQSNSRRSLGGSFSANRTTDRWKINLSAGGNYSENRFRLSEGTTFRAVQRNVNWSGLVVKSLNARWSAGLKNTISSSTFLNQDWFIRLAPGIEFNFFPYAESTRRQFTIQYTAGTDSFDYKRETIFARMEETLVDETLIVSLDLRQPWGSAGLSFEGSHYFNDPSKYRLTLFGHTDVRLFRGLSFNVFGDVSRLHDQIYLARGVATDEEILVRQRQLFTAYRYFVGFGVTYSFGSRFQNVVNPRFGGSSGGFIVMF